MSTSLQNHIIKYQVSEYFFLNQSNFFIELYNSDQKSSSLIKTLTFTFRGKNFTRYR